ncbi:DsbA family oxidoreductase [Streptomyces profundus]|uniref:DsbA family oxidoreductase n=1 Tax=Streptomyces profundus TaxID=2867410 RepID=UPI001D166306|nr:DsbA family oxidoreductase [Streptomyces sp. MA3_2.13]UED88281.1 DsbA family oxidoreductase [Streptomyces sp. MA3_2.13]
MRVDIWGDIVCPWCYIGTARFDRALAGFEHRERVTVAHRSFELDPTRDPGRTEPIERMLARKYGPRAAEMESRVAELARDEGLDYRTDRMVGGTRDAHRLLHFADEHGLRHRLLTQLYEANFGQGESVFTSDALVAVAERVGLDADAARAVLDDPERYLDAVHADQREAARLGANGVPFFVLDGRYAVSGGQSVDTFEQALRRAWGDRPLDTLGDADGDVCGPDGAC